MNWIDVEANPPREGQLVIAFNGMGHMAVGFAKKQVYRNPFAEDDDPIHFWIAENPKSAYMDEEEKKALLDTPDLEDNGKQASKDYANQYLDKVIPKEPSIDIPYNAKKTPTVKNTSKEGIQTKSPFSNVKMPAKPPTGAHK